jgi:hypothetical protein
LVSCSHKNPAPRQIRIELQRYPELSQSIVEAPRGPINFARLRQMQDRRETNVSQAYLKCIWRINRSSLKVLGDGAVHTVNSPAKGTGNQTFEGNFDDNAEQYLELFRDPSRNSKNDQNIREGARPPYQ